MQDDNTSVWTAADPVPPHAADHKQLTRIELWYL